MSGRALMVTSGSANYQYFLGDYLSSTRAVVQERSASYTVMATMEAARSGEEESQFLHYDQAVRVKADLFNHTADADAHYALRLSGGSRQATGLARSLSVMPGDTVWMEVFGKYLDLNRQQANPALLARKWPPCRPLPGWRRLVPKPACPAQQGRQVAAQRLYRRC